MYTYVSAGSSEYESAGQHSSTSSLERDLALTTSLDKSRTPQEKEDHRGKECAAQNTNAVDRDTFRSTVSKLGETLPERSNSVIGNEIRQHQRPPPADGYSLSYPRSRRREPGDLGSMGKGGSPLRAHHRRIHSLSISANSSRSTSAYSTLSERSERTSGVDDSESILSSRTRVTAQSRMEQSRVDTSSVINELLQDSDLSRSDGEAAGLQIYVDRTKGECVVAGPDLQRYVQMYMYMYYY